MRGEAAQHVVDRRRRGQMAGHVGQTLAEARFIFGTLAQQAGLECRAVGTRQHAHGFILNAAQAATIQQRPGQ